MTTLDEIIRNRRSIRSYSEEIPDGSFIDKMLESATFSPSPSNSQPVRFILVESTELKNHIHKLLSEGRDNFLEYAEKKDSGKSSKNMIRSYYRFAEFMINAPLLFAVGTIKTRSFSDRLIEAGLLDENPKGSWDSDISTGLALSLFMLKATELGLGTCILSAPFVFIPGLSEKIHPDIRVTCFVTAGFPAETPRPVNRINAREMLITV